MVTDRCPSNRAVMKMIGYEKRQKTGRHIKNRTENSHLPFRRREQAVSRLRGIRSLQKFASVHSSAHNHFNRRRLLEPIEIMLPAEAEANYFAALQKNAIAA